MVRSLKFHCDEHIPNAVAIPMRIAGFDITTTYEAGLGRQSDADHLDFIRRANRTLFTRDSDFKALHERGLAQPHPGIVYCPQFSRISIGQMVRGLLLLDELLTPDEMVNRLEYLTADRLRGL